MTTRAEALESIVENLAGGGYEDNEDTPNSVLDLIEDARKALATAPDLAPLVLVHVDGGIAEEWYVVPGTGIPHVDILDFDREGEDDDDRNDFVARARATLAKYKARGIDTSDLDADVDDLDDRR